MTQTSRRLRRTSVVSAATVTLCLTGAGTAFAGQTPLPAPTSTLTGTLTSDDVPLPPLPDPLQTAVDEVAETLGISPTADDPDPKTRVRHHRKDAEPRVTVTREDTVQKEPAPARHRAGRPAPAKADDVVVPASLPGLRALPAQRFMPVSAQQPAVADLPAPTAATSGSVEGPAPQASASVPDPGRDSGSAAALLAMALVAALGAMHAWLAQRRVFGVPVRR